LPSHKAGEIASRLAVEALREFLRGSASGAEGEWPFGSRRGLTKFLQEVRLVA
jgi:hypothetical protein